MSKQEIIQTLDQLDDSWFLNSNVENIINNLMDTSIFTKKQLNIIKDCSIPRSNAVAIVSINTFKFYPNTIQLRQISNLFDEYEIIEDFRPKYFKVAIKDKSSLKLQPMMKTFFATKHLTGVKLYNENGIRTDLLLNDDESNDLFAEFVGFLNKIRLIDLAKEVVDRNGFTLQELL